MSEETPIEYDEWFMVEFQVKKHPQLKVEELVNDVRMGLRTGLEAELNLEIKDITIRGKTITQVPSTTHSVPFDMKHVVYREKDGKKLFSETGDIGLQIEGEVEGDMNNVKEV